MNRRVQGAPSPDAVLRTWLARFRTQRILGSDDVFEYPRSFFAHYFHACKQYRRLLQARGVALSDYQPRLSSAFFMQLCNRIRDFIIDERRMYAQFHNRAMFEVRPTDRGFVGRLKTRDVNPRDGSESYVFAHNFATDAEYMRELQQLLLFTNMILSGEPQRLKTMIHTNCNVLMNRVMARDLHARSYFLSR